VIALHLRMAWRSLRRTPGLTVAMVTALSLGIATWYAQHQVFVFLEDNFPVARRGLYNVALDRGEVATLDREVPFVSSILLTPYDAERVLGSGAARRETMTFSAPALLEPEGRPAETVHVRYTTRDLFALFDLGFVDGGPWLASADAGLLGATLVDEAVIDEALARRLFGTAAAVGRRLRVDGAELQVVGVTRATRYRAYERFAQVRDDIYMPLAQGAAARAEPDMQHVVAAGETGSIQVWVELATPADRAAFLAHVDAHIARERTAGRIVPLRAVTLRSSEQFLDDLFRMGGSINLWPMLAGMCLATCVVTLIWMLMTKFSGRSRDLGLLRAFGARRRALMGQLLLEAALVGLIAGVCGVALGVAIMPLATPSIDLPGTITVISLGDAITTIGASVAGALIAALYPTWRLSRGTPAVQLRRT
jgi:putative ABC transport system permease protein